MPSPSLPLEAAAALLDAVDVEAKVARALDAVGELSGRTVLALDAGSGLAARVAADLSNLGVRVVLASDQPVDAVVGLWSTFRGIDPAEIAAAEARLRPGGALLVVHHYGRDDVAPLLPDRDLLDTWSRRNGPFLAAGFRMRVVHAWWTFPDAATLESALGETFGEAGLALAAAARRPRLAWKVVVYHRRRLG